MKYAVVLTVEERFVLEVEAANKAEAVKKACDFAESQDLTITEDEEPLPIRTVK